MAEIPEWYDGKHVNEVKFCEEFLREHPMKSVNGTFFTIERRVTDEDKLRRDYDSAVAILEQIPAEVLEFYKQPHRKERENAYDR